MCVEPPTLGAGVVLIAAGIFYLAAAIRRYILLIERSRKSASSFPNNKTKGHTCVLCL